MVYLLATAVLLFFVLSWFLSAKLDSRSRPLSLEPIEELLERDGPVAHVPQPAKPRPDAP